ncbi:MAG: hypothetical protein ACJ8NS_09050 [Chthoniobacterales bacterium]
MTINPIASPVSRPAHDVRSLSRFIAAAVRAAQAGEDPFEHIVLRNVFPDDLYAAMLSAMPVSSYYRPISGRGKVRNLIDGVHTRVKVDLFPEYIRGLQPEQRAVWNLVGQALCSAELKNAFVERLGPGLERRFGPDFAKARLYPIPILTRDVPGYFITPHPDTRWKGVTVQFYLPPDETISHVGTIFYEHLPDGNFREGVRMQFLPNSGYAFAVGKETWHAVDKVGPEVKTRDSILLTYFVDNSPLLFVRNRGRRISNFVDREFRRRFQR